MNRQRILQQFRTDWRLTKPWIIVWCVACFIHTLLRCLQTFAGIEMAFLETVYRIDWLALVACGMMLVQRLIHLDPFVEAPGVTWRVRPASQWDVFFGKMLMVVVAMIGVPLVFETGYFAASGAGGGLPRILLEWFVLHAAWLLSTMALATATASGRQFLNACVWFVLTFVFGAVGYLLVFSFFGGLELNLKFYDLAAHGHTLKKLILRPSALIPILLVASLCSLVVQLSSRRQRVAQIALWIAIPLFLLVPENLQPWLQAEVPRQNLSNSTPPVTARISPLGYATVPAPPGQRRREKSRITVTGSKSNYLHRIIAEWRHDLADAGNPTFDDTPVSIRGFEWMNSPLQQLSWPDLQSRTLVAGQQPELSGLVLLSPNWRRIFSKSLYISGTGGEQILDSGRLTFSALLIESKMEHIAEIPFAAESRYKDDRLSFEINGLESDPYQTEAFIVARRERYGEIEGLWPPRPFRMQALVEMILVNRSSGEAAYLLKEGSRNTVHFDWHRRTSVDIHRVQFSKETLKKRFQLGDANVYAALFRVNHMDPIPIVIDEPNFRNMREPFESIDAQIEKLSTLELPSLNQENAIVSFCVNVINHAPPPEITDTDRLVNAMAIRLAEIGHNHLSILMYLGDITIDPHSDDEAIRAIASAIGKLAQAGDRTAIVHHNSPAFDLVPIIERMGWAEIAYEDIRTKADGSSTVPRSWAWYLIDRFGKDDEQLLIRHLSDPSLQYEKNLFKKARSIREFPYEQLLDDSWARRVQWSGVFPQDSDWKESYVAYTQLCIHMIESGRDEVCLEGFDRINRALTWVDEGWNPIVDALSPISDCPPGISDALPWLKRHLHNLRFDAGSGRYLETNQTEQK